MNRISLLITCASIFFLTSCKEKVHESLQILIRNRTDSLIHVCLYPKAEYRNGTLYRTTDIGSGFGDAEFGLEPNENTYDLTRVIYTSSNLDIEPHALASEVFDSIHIRLSDKDSTVIKFTPEKVTGYSENIFSEYSTWDYCISEWNAQTQFSKNPQKDHCYSFFISEDKMINKEKDENNE